MLANEHIGGVKLCTFVVAISAMDSNSNAAMIDDRYEYCSTLVIVMLNN